MRSLSDAALKHLREVADWPDLSDTRYEVLERVARGGMGTVFRVRDRILGREVALKVINLPDSGPETVARAMREARVLAQLEHPGIVPIHDVGTLPDGRIFYTMKLVRGRRLDEYLRQAPPSDQRLRIFMRICEAVAFAHAQGVVHRDLKLENVMVGAFGEVLVMDWGVAKLLEEPKRDEGVRGPPPGSAGFEPERVPSEGDEEWHAPVDTVTGTVLGTPGYMPPEQAVGAGGAVDQRADIYALGILLGLVLTRDHGEESIDAESEDRGGRGLPRPLVAILRKATAPNPEDRYPSVDELAGDIARYQAALPVAAHRERLWDRAVRLFKKYRTPILLVLAYLVMRALLLAFANR